MAHYDILAFINDLFWIFLFFSLVFFMIDELFVKTYTELTFLKHYIYIENAWVKVFVFNKVLSAYFVFLRKCYFKNFASTNKSLNDAFIFAPISSDFIAELSFERRSREKFLKKFKQL